MNRLIIVGVLIILVLLGLSAIGIRINNTAFERAQSACNEKWQKATNQEVNRQIQANREVLQKAEKTIKDLHEENARLDNEIVHLEEEAASDPDADNCGVNVDSVQRLNKLQRD